MDQAPGRRAESAAAQQIGEMSDRDLFMAGVALYWAEGSKDRPYDRRENVISVNSDPGVIELCLAWLDLPATARDRLRYNVMIHETADATSAERYRANLVGADHSAFDKTTLKKHNPETVGRNVGEN